MKYLLTLLIAMIFIGCGDGEDRVASSGAVESANVVVPLNVGETRSFELNLDSEKYYMVTAEPVDNSKKISYRVDHLNRTYPEIIITGVSPGTEYFTVTAQEANGLVQKALIRADVNSSDANASSYIDLAVGGSAGGVIPDDGSDGGTDGDGDSTTPPAINPVTDPDACNDDDPTWATVGDSWGTPGGQFSSDLHFWVRSQIPVEPSNVTIYYKRETVSKTENYIVLGSYLYSLSNGSKIKFDLQVLQELAGKFPYFYVKHVNDCFRARMPSSPIVPPDKTLTPVHTGTIF